MEPDSSGAGNGPSSAPARALAPPPGTSAKALRIREVVLAVAGVTGGALAVFALLAARASTSGGVEASDGGPAGIHAPLSADDIAPAPVKWTADRSAVWVGKERRGIAFEVRAERPVDVWTRTVHPALVVRCVAGDVEAFVYTDSPARMEPDTPDHTVTFRIDDGEPATERWPDAIAHDGLFAPDGGAFADRLARARRLTFGFTPHNASPVTAEFQVSGLEELMAGAPPCSARK